MTVRREVINEHLSGPKMQRNVGSLTSATLQPHTGTLRRSIRVRIAKNGNRVTAYIGTDTWYGKLHERGLGGMPKRPFLAPSVRKKRPEIVDFLLQAMMRSYRGK